MVQCIFVRINLTQLVNNTYLSLKLDAGIIELRLFEYLEHDSLVRECFIVRDPITFFLRHVLVPLIM